MTSDTQQKTKGYLSHRALVGLKHYKYKPAGYTILDVIHTPFWNWFVDLLPMWLAPNLITLTGLIGVWVAYALNTFYMLNYNGPAPTWVYLYSCIAVVVYVNLDCIDGKQARRTRSSSPLGQLFDHGCDALACSLLLQNVHANLDYPCNWKASATMGAIMVPWLLAHWEEYHTGVLQYGNGWFGVLEANYALSVVHIITYTLGKQFWTRIAVDTVVMGTPVLLESRHVFMILCIIGGIIQIFGQLGRTLAFDPKDLPAEERGNKELGLRARLLHLVYVVGLVGLGGWWTSDSLVVAGQCRLVSMAYCFLYALVSSQLIIAHMAKEPVTPSLSAWAYAVLLLGSLNTYLHVVDTFVAAAVLAAVAAVGYLHFVTSVVVEIGNFLGIHVLLIGSKEA